MFEMLLDFTRSHLNLSLNRTTAQDMRRNDKTKNYMTEGDIKLAKVLKLS